MTAAHCLFIILLCAALTAYTWGMRGTIIGGERGALLPGAALGLVLVFAGGSVPFSQAFPFAATIGACAMFFGGAQTYGETIDLSADSERPQRLRGHFGVLLKGALWFAVFGGVFADGMLAIVGRFNLLRTILFAVLSTVSFGAGVVLLRLLCKKDGKLRRVLFFSRTRAESWGGLLFVCLFLIVFNALHKQAFPLLLGLFGAVFGGLGFWFGNLLRLLIGKKCAPSSVVLRYIDPWKAMECVFGALGGAGIALGWCVMYNRYVRVLTDELVAHSGVWDPIRDKTDNILLFAYLAFFVVYLLLSVTLKKRRETVEDILIWPLFCAAPLCLAMTGGRLFGQLFSFGMLLFVLAEKFTLSRRERYENLGGAKIVQCVLMLLTAAAFGVLLFTDFAFSAFQTMCLYTLGYIAAAAYLIFDPKRLRSLRAGKPSMNSAAMTLSVEWTWLICGGALAIAALLMSGRCFLI